jgi:hypothetical protein
MLIEPVVRLSRSPGVGKRRKKDGERDIIDDVVIEK